MKNKIIILSCLVLVILGLSLNIKIQNREYFTSNQEDKTGFNINQSTFDYKEDNVVFPINKFEELQIDENFSNISLSLELDETNSTVYGILDMFYYNNDPVSFDQIPFHLFPSGMAYENRSGYIEILNVTVADTITTYENLSDQQLLWIDLISTLNYEENVTIRIEFLTTMPDALDRMNVNGEDDLNTRIYKFAAGYPIPCVYDEWDGWNIDPYIHEGDPFYSDMAYYEINVTTPNNMVVAATGELMNKIIGENTTKHIYRPILPVREITFSASRYFIVESILVNGINVSSYYLPKSTDNWETYALETTIDALLFYNNSFGIYPYTTFNIVEEFTLAGGMEYPCQVYISEIYDYRDDPHFYMEMVIAHEVAHQWWYQLVGNDEVDEGFLDEGLTSWSTDYYRDYKHPDWGLFDPYWPWEEVTNYNITVGLPNRINQSCADYPENDSNFGFVGYRKAPVILEKLRLTIGEDNFLTSLQLYFQRHKFEFGTLTRLQDAFEDTVGYDLDWFFLPWYNNNYLPKYQFENVMYDSVNNNMTLTIVDVNEELHNYSYSQQIYILITDIRGDGIFYYNQFWINGTTEITFNLMLEIGNKPFMAIQSYTKDVIVQLDEYQSNYQIYSDYSNWYEEPNLSWISFIQGDTFKWKMEANYKDAAGLQPLIPIEFTEFINFEVLGITSSDNHLLIDSFTSRSAASGLTNHPFAPYTGTLTFGVDQEGSVMPYVFSLFSPFVGVNFEYTEIWVDSLQITYDWLYDMGTSISQIEFELVEISNNGKKIELDATQGNSTIDFIAEYDNDGILRYLSCIMDSFQINGEFGPELTGYVLVELYEDAVNSSTESSKDTKTHDTPSFSPLILVLAIILSIYYRKRV